MNLSLDPAARNADRPALGSAGAMSLAMPDRREERAPRPGEAPAARALRRTSDPVWRPTSTDGVPLRAVRRAACMDELEASGLVGHGGAWFPVATKWRGRRHGSRRRPVVDRQRRRGRAGQSEGCVPAHARTASGAGRPRTRGHDTGGAGRPSSTPLGEHPDRGRRCRRTTRPTPRPDRDRGLSRRRTPTSPARSRRWSTSLGRPPRSHPLVRRADAHPRTGVGGRPTLVQNVETLAHVALIARSVRHGSGGSAHRTIPGTMLLTVTAPADRLVVEAVLGSPLRQATGLRPERSPARRRILLGGYGGGWVSPTGLQRADRCRRRLPGVLAQPSGRASSPSSPATSARWPNGGRRAATWRAREQASVGPASVGLAELADAMERLAYGGAGDLASSGSSKSAISSRDVEPVAILTGSPASCGADWCLRRRSGVASRRGSCLRGSAATECCRYPTQRQGEGW